MLHYFAFNCPRAKTNSWWGFIKETVICLIGFLCINRFSIALLSEQNSLLQTLTPQSCHYREGWRRSGETKVNSGESIFSARKPAYQFCYCYTHFWNSSATTVWNYNPLFWFDKDKLEDYSLVRQVNHLQYTLYSVIKMFHYKYVCCLWLTDPKSSKTLRYLIYNIRKKLRYLNSECTYPTVMCSYLLFVPHE